MQVSVIIPVYNALPLARECVASIFAADSKLIFEVVVVDNGSTPEVQEWLVREEESRPNLRHLRYPEPLGFARAVNAGACSAAGEVIVILNSDTIVTPGWMDGLYLALSADPSLGAITPCSNSAGDAAQIDFRTVDLSRSAALALVSAKPNPPRTRYLPQRVSFFCAAVRRELWRELGGLDESYGVGNFEDDHFCLRLRVAGFRLAVAEHLFVYHHHSATFRANGIGHQTWMTQNAALFATHAREFAEAPSLPAPRWPKRSAPDISVVILPRQILPEQNGQLERTLRSLRNQTVSDFEILTPGSAGAPGGVWIAYVTEGDILYPFHLEALHDVLQHDALQRNSSHAVFADGWISGATKRLPHPDAAVLKLVSSAPVFAPVETRAPRMLAGWMHHHSLDPKELWKQTTPLHWPSLGWEMLEAPPPSREADLKPARSRAIIESARSLYRGAVPYETRLSIDARIRKMLGPLTGSSSRQHPMQEIADRLAAVVGSRIDAGKFSSDAALPDVFLFNIIPWKALVQRPHHFARGLAERGHRVFWVETGLRSDRNWWTGRPFEQVCPGVHLVQLPGFVQPPGRCDIYSVSWDPVVLEAMSSALAQIASAYGVRQAVSLVHFPRWEPLVLRARDQFGWKMVYDCLDDQRAFAALYQTQLRQHEAQLIHEADSLITSSAVLQQRLLKGRPNILLHNAADYRLFSSSTLAGHLRHLPRPIAGFFGAFADWLDVELIRNAARQLPNWSFVYIGAPSFSRPEAEARWLECTSGANITVLPQMDPGTLAAFLAEFDVCTMPFLDVPVTQTMNPVKIYEYLAAGKPVVSRDLPEVRHASDLISLYSTPEEFVAQLRSAVAGDNSDRIRQRQNFAKLHDWSARVDVLAGEIARMGA
jgi:GT2 family glycosyltransferase/glycosyltransferase involved in cell wall biosynthesis